MLLGAGPQNIYHTLEMFPTKIDIPGSLLLTHMDKKAKKEKRKDHRRLLVFKVDYSLIEASKIKYLANYQTTYKLISKIQCQLVDIHKLRYATSGVLVLRRRRGVEFGQN